MKITWGEVVNHSMYSTTTAPNEYEVTIKITGRLNELLDFNDVLITLLAKHTKPEVRV